MSLSFKSLFSLLPSEIFSCLLYQYSSTFGQLVTPFSLSSILYPFNVPSTTMSPESHVLLPLSNRVILIFPAPTPKLFFRPIIAHLKPIKGLIKIKGLPEITSGSP